MANEIYTIVDGKIVPYVAKNGKRFNTRSKAQKRKHTQRAKRSIKFNRFYQSYKWKKLSKSIRQQHPLCAECLRKYHAGKIPLEKVNIATSVDHIVKLSEDWSKRFDRSNLQPLCWSCHRKKDGNSIKFYNRRQINDCRNETNPRGGLKAHQNNGPD